MPTLDWIGKRAVVQHHKEVPFHLLKCNEELSVGKKDTGNLLIQGDNLLALKALLPHYAGKVKCIYIDPPYNTGNENWVYNDNVNSPEIKEWLGKVVGKEAEDLSRHDKWLCMMYPRLKIAKDFLSDDGIIFVSIDDTSIHWLRLIMDEIFSNNLLACFVWQTAGNFDNQAKVKICHEYVLTYVQNPDRFPPPAIIDPNISEDSKLYKDSIRNTIVKNGPKNPVSEVLIPSGFPTDFESGTISRRDDQWPQYNEDILIKHHQTQNPVIARSGWSSKKIFEKFIQNEFHPVLDTKNQETTFVITKTGAIENIKKRSGTQSHVISVLRNLGNTQSTSAKLLRKGIKFDYPKPNDLLKYLISMVRGKDFTVMDFFSGSASSAVAVSEMNGQDGGNRKFILIELEPKIVKNVIVKRLTSLNSNISFRYCELGGPLFDANGQIKESVSFEDLARHVFFTETREPLANDYQAESPLVGLSHGTAIYLLYNGILKDKSVNGGNVLTSKLLSELPQHSGSKVIYGMGCRMSKERLQREGIVFRQIPYQIQVS